MADIKKKRNAIEELNECTKRTKLELKNNLEYQKKLLEAQRELHKAENEIKVQKDTPIVQKETPIVQKVVPKDINEMIAAIVSQLNTQTQPPITQTQLSSEPVIPTTETQIANPSSTNDSEEINYEEFCYICKWKLDIGYPYGITGCDHYIHTECYSTWCNKNKTMNCPICSAPFTSFIKVDSTEENEEEDKKEEQDFTDGVYITSKSPMNLSEYNTPPLDN